jgi:streptogramin lyase
MAASVLPITPLGDREVQVIAAGPHPDWIVGANRRVWVTGVGAGIAVFEPATGTQVASIAVDGKLCGAPAAGFGSVWFPTCEPGAVHQVSATTYELVATTPVELPSAGEFTIGAGEGGIWAILADDGDSGPSRLARIDPDARRTVDAFEVPGGAWSVRAGAGALWVAYPEENHVLRVDPANGKVTATVETGLAPRFLIVDEVAVWVLNQGSGSVTRIDSATADAIEVDVDDGPMKGGDIAAGHGSVWVRGTRELVARIDPATNALVERIGEPSAGSASVAAVEGQLWISAGAECLLYRITLG